MRSSVGSTYITILIREIISICDRVMLIDSGKIAWDGKLEDYKALVAEQQSQMANKKIVS